MYGLTSEQSEYVFEEIVKILKSYGMSNTQEIEKCTHLILDEVDYAIENK